MCRHVSARGKIHGHELKDVPVLNAGDWFGKTWLIEIGGSYSSYYLVVEADSMADAIDELAEHEKYGHHIVVPEKDLGDYDPNDCHHGPSGQVLHLDHLMVHGREGHDRPFPCLYFADDLPEVGIDPLDYPHWDECCDTR